ncbi:hypothetical protein N7535_000597 [Penicillium sp. DV-2018c]|nr:hypothetical protein N7461_006151 [Penicillium sp. DV-2018c]KAJ5581977.1 hypothetical protein N7535_000597 [Penicillium sp. DV-2018c]
MFGVIQFGRLTHYAFDAVLYKITENKDIKKWVDSYLGVGEWVMDQSVAVMGSSAWFERRR